MRKLALVAVIAALPYSAVAQTATQAPANLLPPPPESSDGRMAKALAYAAGALLTGIVIVELLPGGILYAAGEALFAGSTATAPAAAAAPAAATVARAVH